MTQKQIAEVVEKMPSIGPIHVFVVCRHGRTHPLIAYADEESALAMQEDLDKEGISKVDVYSVPLFHLHAVLS